MKFWSKKLIFTRLTPTNLRLTYYCDGLFAQYFHIFSAVHINNVSNFLVVIDYTFHSHLVNHISYEAFYTFPRLRILSLILEFGAKVIFQFLDEIKRRKSRYILRPIRLSVRLRKN